MNVIPYPICQQTGPTSRQIGRKLARVLAIMRRQEAVKSPANAKSAAIRNPMSAFATWEHERDGTATDEF